VISGKTQIPSKKVILLKKELFQGLKQFHFRKTTFPKKKSCLALKQFSILENWLF